LKDFSKVDLECSCSQGASKIVQSKEKQKAEISDIFGQILGRFEKGGI
jgi:hypothetical protein